MIQQRLYIDEICTWLDCDANIHLECVSDMMDNLKRVLENLGLGTDSRVLDELSVGGRLLGCMQNEKLDLTS